ncbi:helix-turn-helix domain-containing protein [Halobacteriovorax sp. HLS]|uniref:helix-turn-helix domain-containing protein n=1 Tax=Halobacteriovorax sp. HLS TaxID=2234000 RepID=UPI000FD88021|nr:helix-turn-helix transcriptional regulator [Halobacteriovorax sp. HLS]
MRSMKKDEIAQRVADRIKSIRENLGLTQARLASDAGITPAAISQIEAAERVPSTPVLRRLASVLRVSTDYLLGNSDDSELSDLLQDENIQSFFRDYKNLSPEDQNQMKSIVEILKAKKKS